MAEVTFVRWRKYGHDRLYVSGADGSRLGYLDVASGRLHPVDGAEEGVLADLIAAPAETAVVEVAGVEVAPALDVAAPASSPAMGREIVGPTPASAPTLAPAPAPAPAPEPEPEPEPEPSESGSWTDLVDRAAGAAAREQAVALRRAAPVRTFVARLVGAKTEERAWRIGADGEQAVAKQLRSLGPSWRALHAVPVGSRGSDIDHVVVGPGGVFTVNAKHHPDAAVWSGGNTLLVNGVKTQYIRNSRFEADRAGKLLAAVLGQPVEVVGLVVLVGVRGGLTVKSHPPGGRVFVLPRLGLAEWLRQRGQVLSPEQVEAVFEVARRSTTWAG